MFVLLIAGINYTNLTTARATSRIKEIGVRKAIGAVRGNLVPAVPG
jgi:putative ABC transport system permease protein